METTQIQVRKTTRQVLKNLKLVNKESYEEVILRLINNQKLKGGEKYGN